MESHSLSPTQHLLDEPESTEFSHFETTKGLQELYKIILLIEPTTVATAHVEEGHIYRPIIWLNQWAHEFLGPLDHQICPLLLG